MATAPVTAPAPATAKTATATPAENTIATKGATPTGAHTGINAATIVRSTMVRIRPATTDRDPLNFVCILFKFASIFIGVFSACVIDHAVLTTSYGSLFISNIKT